MLRIWNLIFFGPDFGARILEPGFWGPHILGSRFLGPDFGVQVWESRFWSPDFGSRKFGPRNFGILIFENRFLESRSWRPDFWSPDFGVQVFGPRFWSPDFGIQILDSIFEISISGNFHFWRFPFLGVQFFKILGDSISGDLDLDFSRAQQTMPGI